MEGDNGDKAAEFKVFVGGISYRMDEKGLLELFERYKPDTSTIQLDKMTNKPRGFGFVTFKDRESMLDAIRDLHNKDIDGRPISVKEAIPQDQIKPGTPASALTRGGSRDGGGRYDRYPDRRYGDRGGYDRYAGGGGGGGGGGGYDRGGYDRYGGGGGAYGDPRQYDYGRAGYNERGGGYGAAYGGAYERDPYYRDPYARDPYAAQPYGGGGGGGYDRPYDSRYPPAYDSRYPAEYPPRDDRYGHGAGGPDRSRYPAGPPRAAPYDRPDARRDARR